MEVFFLKIFVGVLFFSLKMEESFSFEVMLLFFFVFFLLSFVVFLVKEFFGVCLVLLWSLGDGLLEGTCIVFFRGEPFLGGKQRHFEGAKNCGELDLKFFWAWRGNRK